MKASVYIAASLDGYIARENGDIDWLTGGEAEPPDEDYGYEEFMDSVNVLVMGRNTYDKVLTFGEWPYGDKRVVVLTNRPFEPVSIHVEGRSGTPRELIDELSAEGVDHIYVDGGTTIQEFLRAGLIQNVIVTRIPVLIGSGIPLFGGLDEDVRLRHLSTQAYPDGLVQSRYEVIE